MRISDWSSDVCSSDLFSIRLFENAKGRRLSSIECHDLLCKVADIVVVGGVRRSAMIALFDCTDDRMSRSKTGAWWDTFGYRRLANNSAVYERRRPDIDFFRSEEHTSELQSLMRISYAVFCL